MKRRIALILLVLFAFLSVALILLVSQSRNEFYAVGRIKIEPGESDMMNGRYAYYTPLETISNFLCSSVASNQLASVSEISGNFWLVKVEAVRSTRLARLCYASDDSEGTERIASNACIMVQRFFSTNRPSLQVEYVDTSPDDPPKTWWQRIISNLNEMF